MTSLYPTAAGMITAIGLDRERTIASLRSGLDGFSRTPFAGSDGQDLQVAGITGYADAIGGVDRYETLAIAAITPCLDGLSDYQRGRVGILLGLPRPERPGVPEDLAPVLRERLARRLDLPEQLIHPVAMGRVSAFWSLAQADRLLREGRFDNCIVGGVDVLVNGASLSGLSRARLLKEEWDGFIPGEAAAFVRLAAQASSGIWGTPAVRIAGAGLAAETADGSAARPLVGVGVNAAFRAAAADAGSADSAVNLLINDVNGARPAFEDQAMGRVRFFRSPDYKAEVWHTASYLGETGAAVGAIQIIWAAAALELGFSPGSGVMLSCADADQRAAVFMRGAEARAVQAQAGFAVGAGEPILHALQEERDAPLPDAPGVSLRGENLHADLVWRNFQELGWLWGLREHHHQKSGDPWMDIESFEHRLVAHLDAIAWSGAMGRKVAAEHLFSEDMDEAAAAVLSLLSFPPSHAVLQTVCDAMLASEERARAIMATLPHLPAQATDPILHWALNSGKPPLVVGGLRALTTAGRISEDILRPLLAADAPAVIVELIHAAGAAGLTQLWDDLQSSIAANPAVQLAGVNRLAYLSVIPAGVSSESFVDDRFALEMPLASALICSRDGSSFFEVASRLQMTSPPALEALGWYGDTAATELLLAMLDQGSDVQQPAAANALYRIYGVACREKVKEAEPAEGDEDSSGQAITRLSQQRSAWEVAIGNLSFGSQRLRHGAPWSRRSAIEHLKRPEQSFSERLVAAWEYAVVNRAPLPCYPSLFVQRQRKLLSGLA